MTEIRIKFIELLNFKGVRSLQIDFGHDETCIYGANGTGKTTIFDAFLWVLFGKDSNTRKDFNIKPLSNNGIAIPKIPHEVKLTLSVNEEEIVLTKRLVEKWTKKRGSAVETFSGNSIECYYNEVPCTATEYDKKIAALCDEGIFKLITNPMFFTSLSKDNQRQMLIDLAGEISIEEIIGNNEAFRELVNHLTGKSLEEYKKEILCKRKVVKDEIDTIPARIDERKRDIALLGNGNADEARKEIARISQSLAEIDEQIADRSKAYEAITQERNEKSKQLASLLSDKSKRELELQNRLTSEWRERDNAHNQAVARVERLGVEQRLKQLALPRLQEELDALNDKRNSLLAEWRGLKASEFTEPDRANFVCPTCKRPLEATDIDAKIEQMRADFNANKIAKQEANKKLGMETTERIKAKMAEIEEQNKELVKLQTEIESVSATETYKVTPIAPQTAGAIQADETIKSLSSKIEAIRADLESPIVAPDLSDLQNRRQVLTDEIDVQRKIINAQDVKDANQRRIADLEHEYQERQTEIARLEGIEFTIQQFAKARIEKVEERINGLFKLVKFKLYEQQLNGGEVETCEAMIDGVPYRDLNSASKINAGLDIINAICKRKGFYAPVFIDNRESVSELISTQSQIINLIVDENSKEIKII